MAGDTHTGPLTAIHTHTTRDAMQRPVNLTVIGLTEEARVPGEN